MKKQTLLKVPAIPPGAKGKKKKSDTSEGKQQITAQTHVGCLILDVWEKNKHVRRHVMDISTGEYATYHMDTGHWTAQRFDIAELGHEWQYCSFDASDYKIAEADREVILAAVPEKCTWQFSHAGCLSGMLLKESEYGEQRENNKKASKERRLRDLMDSVPAVSAQVRAWVIRQAAGNTQYAFYNKKSQKYHCTACGKDFTAQKGAKIRDGGLTRCPACDAELSVRKRKASVTKKLYFTIIHNLDEKRGIERHFRAEIEWSDTRHVYIDETIRCMLMRDDKRYNARLYYSDLYGEWSEGNRANRRWNACLLYPSETDIREGLEGTAYAPWADIFAQMAQAGVRVNYDFLMMEAGNQSFVDTTEYLFKGRFYRLLKEVSERISCLFGYLGSDVVNMGGKDIEQVMRMDDRQKINRLRDLNGGMRMLGWLQWADTCNKRISTEVLQWYDTAGIGAKYYRKSHAAAYMSPEQLMHYLIRQQNESYPHYKYVAILNQLEDYLIIAQNLGKPMDDALTYRPRELKRRHDEAVEEYNLRQKQINAEREAQKMREKYPGYEDILQEIKTKFEFGDDDYTILVPNDFVEITAEGIELHHCVASTERYFDRIISRETYICFLRRTQEPDKPFYTIEVEPGGTIRQHRGAYDEEPGIEEIKPFLRKWQQEIRRRMSKEDHDHAKKSAELRRKNIDELIAKNNTRVLEGLMEDLMEVI